jgi:hypothetical protein
MSKLVSDIDSALAGIRSFNSHLPNFPLLADRLGQAHAFYVIEQENGEPLFAFSKYVGYDKITPEIYLRDYKELDGRNTEHALSKWFEEVRLGTPAYNELITKLTDLLSFYGKRPRSGKSQQVRLMVVRPEYREKDLPQDHDRKLLELLIAVANTLPTSQRHVLRASL